MKLNPGRRILMFLHWLCTLLVSAALVLLIWKPPFAVELYEKAYAKVTSLFTVSQLKIIAIAVRVLYVILLIAQLCLVFKRKKKVERGFIVMDTSDSGRVRIAVSAIEQMVRRSVTNIDGITDMKIKIESDDDAINIRVNASLINGGHVPTVTMNMQQAIRQFVEMNCGVAVRSVPLVIRSVTEPTNRKVRKQKAALAAPAEPEAEKVPEAEAPAEPVAEVPAEEPVPAPEPEVAYTEPEPSAEAAPAVEESYAAETEVEVAAEPEVEEAVAEPDVLPEAEETVEPDVLPETDEAIEPDDVYMPSEAAEPDDVYMPYEEAAEPEETAETEAIEFEAAEPAEDAEPEDIFNAEPEETAEPEDTYEAEDTYAAEDTYVAEDTYAAEDTAEPEIGPEPAAQEPEPYAVVETPANDAVALDDDEDYLSTDDD